MNKDNFIEFVCSDFDFANNIAKNAWEGVNNVWKSNWLKFATVEGVSNVIYKNLIILPPIIPCNTSTYVDVQKLLEDFFLQFIASTNRIFAFVSTDQACFALVWGLKLKFPNKFSWVIPVPGEWHWTWHILKAIFKIWSESHFVPWSVVLNYSSLDVNCKSFHYGEDFLQIITLALFKFVENLKKETKIESVTDLLHNFHNNSQVYELIYLLIYYLCRYWYTRSALKFGISSEINKMWRYWLHLFLAIKK